MDFFDVKRHVKITKEGEFVTVSPEFVVRRFKDLMIRGGAFYAIWDEEIGLWSTDEYDVQRIVDECVWGEYNRTIREKPEATVSVKLLGDFSSGKWAEFQRFVNALSDNSTPLDMDLTFLNDDVKRGDYVSRRLPYSLEAGDISSYDELVGTLYSPEEREKLEWCIGAIVAGEAKHIQKFAVLYGEAGTGKSTVIGVIQKLFDGYYTTFEAKALASSSNAFATEVFRNNPLVAIQHDGDLSKIEDNTKLNSIIAHEEMTMNEKYKASYSSRINAFLFMGTNKPVHITDSKSGIIRRLIDIQPTGNRLEPHRYQSVIGRLDFELGAVAYHCLGVYRNLGKHYYEGYKPVNMMMRTDVFYNFILDSYDVFLAQDGVSLKQAYTMYKEYCDEALIQYRLPKHKFRDELSSYFRSYEDRTYVDGERVRNYFYGFKHDKIMQGEPVRAGQFVSVTMDSKESIFDTMYPDAPAQYANSEGTPTTKWDNVKTSLRDIDTTRVHYVRPPENHIVIDFDLKDENGNKSAELNLAAASKLPATYAEFSQGGAGVHLHYIYDGDPSELSSIFDDGIEIKVFTGKSSLRRRLSLCNTVPVATISSGLPKKEKNSVITKKKVSSEKGLRSLIVRNLNKEFHPGTKPSVDFIKKILDDAYESDLVYDVTDMRSRILAFAYSSTNHSDLCVEMVQEMKFASEEELPTQEFTNAEEGLVFFDVEVFPNLFMVAWKHEGEGKKVNIMLNPSPEEIEALVEFPLVGFNCRRYDNHLLYARAMGYTESDLYKLSQRIINNDKGAAFASAYGLSYADVYDYANTKKSLKKWQLELGITHIENHHPWDEPLPMEHWKEVSTYCANDVVSTEAVHNHLVGDFQARKVLAELSGLTVNDTTQRHAAAIIFEGDRNPQPHFNYVDLSEQFEGYKFEAGKSSYRGREDVGEGGYVYAEPGMYENVLVLDVESMHPSSIMAMNLFGKYTQNFVDILDARLAIKHGEADRASGMLNGALKPYLTSEQSMKDLSQALKIIINIVYGLTAAKFDNPFRDIRNVDNIVAKRGALFMVDLEEFVKERGGQVVHIKTDSVKIPNASDDLVEEIVEFGKSYGYNFDVEGVYERMVLVNKSTFLYKTPEGIWGATGEQFKVPFVFKTLTGQGEVKDEDYTVEKSVTTAMYLDYNEALPDGEHQREFVGRVGRFVPVKPGTEGGILERAMGDDRFGSVGGTKGYRWKEWDLVKSLGLEDQIDKSYMYRLVDEAREAIGQHGDPEWFLG